MKHPPLSKSWDFYDRLLIPAVVVWGGQGSSCRVFFSGITTTKVPLPEYLRVYESCKRIIEGIRPDLVVLDAIFNPGLDACFMLNQKFLLSSPNAPLDATRALQPWLKGFWYYPA